MPYNDKKIWHMTWSLGYLGSLDWQTSYCCYNDLFLHYYQIIEHYFSMCMFLQTLHILYRVPHDQYFIVLLFGRTVTIYIIWFILPQIILLYFFNEEFWFHRIFFLQYQEETLLDTIIIYTLVLWSLNRCLWSQSAFYKLERC